MQISIKFFISYSVLITLITLFSIFTPAFSQNQTGYENVPDSMLLTPKASPFPRINGAKVFGVRPGHPLLFKVPATGKKPITFTADGLPDGLKLDKNSGQITGSVPNPGTYMVTLKVTNDLGSTKREFRICVGDRIALTPPMGWNSYNVYGIENVNQNAIEMNARAMVSFDLINHGWTYVNIDGGWQGYTRSGNFNGINPDSTRFPDLPGLIKTVHSMGLKFGIYHMAYINSYDKRLGATSNNPSGKYERTEELHTPLGKYKFHWNDAQQFALWGVDYLKYDWWYRNLQHAIEMGDALKNINRDIVYSVCNGAGFTNGYFPDYPEAEDHATALSYISNLWRSGSDTENSWKSVVANGFTQNPWRKLTGPGHWNDPDMMLLGRIGWGKDQSPTTLTPDEQYSHMSLWCLLAAPLFLGCDLTKLDDFTLNLITNDEVLEVNQDPLGKQGRQVQLGPYIIALIKELEDGSQAVGFFNLGDKREKIKINLNDIGINGKLSVRDLWRQKDLGDVGNDFSAEMNPHGVVFLKMTPRFD